MSRYVLVVEQIDRSQVGLAGGKGASLGELGRLAGARVPAAFCVTTVAFEQVVTSAPRAAAALQRLSGLGPGDRDEVRATGAEISRAIRAVPVPGDLAAEVDEALDLLGAPATYAVRSSATAEDLPTASFAGQHDSYLNVERAAVLEHVKRCWASLFTERAIAYRLRQAVAHQTVRMAVVVQRMLDPHAAGTLFTADPVTGNRKVATVAATLGLGDALVSGLVSADAYSVRAGRVEARTILTKRLASRPARSGGTERTPVDPADQDLPALSDAQVIRLVELGRRIESHFGQPQDIEWCLVGGEFQIVQSRPITTLFPIPAAIEPGNHVYLSVGHQQMMTDPIKPLGLSVWLATTPRPMLEAGGRLFVDVTTELARPTTREALLALMGRSDPLMVDALRTVIARDFLPTLPDDGAAQPPPGDAPAAPEPDPRIVTELIEQCQASLETLKAEIDSRNGPALVDFIRADIAELQRIMFQPRNMQAIMASMRATWVLNERLQEWLGEKGAVDVLTQSAPGNVTSEMGRALLDVADRIRPHRQVVDFLAAVQDDRFLDALPELPGGPEARDAIQSYLDVYGMRCVGEIDVTRPRWSERPSALLPMLLANIRRFETGAGSRMYEEGRARALAKEQELLQRLRAVPDGWEKAAETKQLIDRLRAFVGYREYPKYHMVSRYFVYKLALLREADRMVLDGVLRGREDIFYLSLDELREVLNTGEIDYELIRERGQAHRFHAALTPPRVLTSDGEGLSGAYRREDLPSGALPGLAVSAGTVEGRARVVADLGGADLGPGDVLVTGYADPSWTPAFVGIAGLVTEVGGLMTHGAVIAREYGLPAVVGVDRATERIRDGQQIRVRGSDGYVEILGEGG